MICPTQVTLKSEDYGKHLLGVQDFIQKHTLSEADITSQTERAKSLKTQAHKFVEEKHPDSAKIISKTSELDAACERLRTSSEHRLSMLQVQWKSISVSLVHNAPIKVLPHLPPYGQR